MNASMGYKHKSNWDIMAGVDNIFNYKDLQYLPGNPGRVGYINFQIHF
jgi:outer membrane receptor protein involved in Fe transport